jgi:hypothetical protein
MANSKEFTRLMNRLDDLGEELTRLRIELNQAVINGTLYKDDEPKQIKLNTE